MTEEETLTLGSLGVITGRDMRGDRLLPYWLEQGVQSALRDADEEIPVQSFSALSSAQSQPRSATSKHVPRSSIILTPTDSPAASPGTHGGGKESWQNLDKFYESESDGEESEASTDASSEDIKEAAESEVESEEESEEQEDDEEDDEEGEEDREESHLTPHQVDS